MDDKKIEEILREDHAPAIDENARKRALNLALAEFNVAQNEKNKKSEKNSQGISMLSRLIGRTNDERGVRTMEQKSRRKLYQGTAMLAVAVALFAAPVAMESMFETLGAEKKIESVMAPSTKADLNSNIPSYVGAVEAQNEDELVAAIRQGQSAIPVPINTPDTRLEVPEGDMEVAAADDPLQRWRVLQEERVENQMAAEGAAAASPAKPYTQYGGGLKDGNAAKEEADAVTPTEGDTALLKKWRAEQEQRALEMMVAEGIMPVPEEWKRSPEDMASIVKQSNDKFEEFAPNPFEQTATNPVSTFSSDVDTASYAFVRKAINSGQLPSPSQVRIEEMVNYFDYNYPLPQNKTEPFKPTVTVMDSPWTAGRKLMHIGIKGYDVPKGSLRSNLVFLLDVSGSMNQQDKLPLVKSSMKMLLDSLHPDDTVSIVTYAGSTGVVLQPTKVSNRNAIMNAMNNLSAGGGTAGAAGIELAYNMAEQNFDNRAVNRVILATDGDFNVGITDRNQLKTYIERKRDKGIFLSVLGFGMGNYNDHLMQTLAQNGNGTAAYIDSLSEAQKVLVQEATSSLFPIAKDVKFQVEFNPAAVAEYRLIGYETRHLNREDFNNDKVDAGDIGAGHTVTAIYEFVPVGSDALTMDPLRYGKVENATDKVKPMAPVNEYAFVKVRYKLPMENTSKLITQAVPAYETVTMAKIECGPNESCPQSAPRDAVFSVAVASFAQMLRGSHYTGDYTYDDVINMAQSAKGDDPYGYRAEFIKMVRLAKTLSR